MLTLRGLCVKYPLFIRKFWSLGEIAWEPKANRGVYLVTWEVDGGGLKGNLFTDSTCVTLSLWPDTIYHIQVELVSRIPGVENLKSEMMDLDTGRAQKVSTETDMNIIPEDAPEDVDFNSPLLSVLFSAVRGENTRHRYQNLELVLGGCAAVFLFAIILAIAMWRCRRRQGLAMENMITGSTSIRSFQSIITVMGPSTEPASNLSSSETPEVAFQGAHNSNFLNQSEKTIQV
ncbi:hypothetical protein NQ314_003372 [Rhamnusium bicolor]|uniref:Fibronectin type-III domain-containing protein n=1 Tax=Rhamnusium bicolor TaxID=1586634 RepID=A0AAV8ZPC8_9CUCU|nr:hypothetical protein NQ314_003372 [Rhamnusium bicolor]